MEAIKCKYEIEEFLYFRANNKFYTICFEYKLLSYFLLTLWIE
jgi:hypothetical protein